MIRSCRRRAACNCGSFCPSARWSGMQRAVLIALILVLTASSADARRRHHRVHFYMRHAPVMMVPPAAAAEFAREPRGRIEAAQIVPRDWQLQPPDPNWQGRRYVAPDGNAWLALYSTNAANDATARFKAVAVAAREEMTYLRGERGRVTVSGLEGGRAAACCAPAPSRPAARPPRPSSSAMRVRRRAARRSRPLAVPIACWISMKRWSISRTSERPAANFCSACFTPPAASSFCSRNSLAPSSLRSSLAFFKVRVRNRSYADALFTPTRMPGLSTSDGVFSAESFGRSEERR